MTMIFVFDIDGTICFNGKFIESRLNQVIQQLNRQHDIIFASARPIRDLLPVVRDYSNHWLIGGNGSIISKVGEIQTMAYIPNDLFEKIVKLISDYDLKYIIDGDFDYAANVSESHPIYRQLNPDGLAKNVKVAHIQHPIKVILFATEEKTFKALKQWFQSYEDVLSIHIHEVDHSIDITAININKHSTLKYMIGAQNYIAFGNDVNDTQLLNHAQQSFYVTGTSGCSEAYDVYIQNNAESVATVIEDLYLSEK